MRFFFCALFSGHRPERGRTLDEGRDPRSWQHPGSGHEETDPESA